MERIQIETALAYMYKHTYKPTGIPRTVGCLARSGFQSPWQLVSGAVTRGCQGNLGAMQLLHIVATRYITCLRTFLRNLENMFRYVSINIQMYFIVLFQSCQGCLLEGGAPSFRSSAVRKPFWAKGAPP